MEERVGGGGERSRRGTLMQSLIDPELRRRAARRARRAWRDLAVLLPVVAGVLVVYTQRRDLFGVDTPVRIAAAVALIILGWAVARAAGQLASPVLARRDIETAGPLGFAIRLLTIGAALVVALRLVGLDPATVAAGGAITAVVLGLAAQQTLGNIFAGVVLLSARPFSVAERVRLQSGGVGGQVEGVVSGFGLMYTSFARGSDKVLVPNSVVLNSAVVPLREPTAVDVQARLRSGTKPTDLQALLRHTITTPVRIAPHIVLEHIDATAVTVRVTATPADDEDGSRLADELLAALGGLAAGPEPPR